MITVTAKRMRGLQGAIFVLLAFFHLVGAVGLPLPTESAEWVVRKAKSGKPFPCQHRPCGCLTYEQCWAGDCCCFTLRQKVAWARENGEKVPSIALAKAAVSEIEEETAPCSCEKKKPACCDSENGTCGQCTSREGAGSGGCCDLKKEKGTPVLGCCSEAGAKASCCEEQTNTPVWKWTLGEWVKKCRGDGVSGPVSLLPPGLPVPLILDISANSGLSTVLHSLRQEASRLPSEPQSPPPKS